MQIQRPTVEQTFSNLALSVTNVAQPLAGQLTLSSLITGFIICNPSTNGNSIFYGDANVTALTGIEITVGSAPFFSIDQVRQLYEIQDPDLISAEAAACQGLQPQAIPLIVWNPSNFYIVAAVAGPTPCSAMFFRQVYL